MPLVYKTLCGVSVENTRPLIDSVALKHATENRFLCIDLRPQLLSEEYNVWKEPPAAKRSLFKERKSMDATSSLGGTVDKQGGESRKIKVPHQFEI